MQAPVVSLRNILAAFVAITICTSCATRRPTQLVLQQKYAPEKLREEMALLKKILEANHPSLYWYTPKDSIDDYFHTAMAGITDSLTLPAYRNTLSWVIGKIRCGHTAVRYPSGFADANMRNRGPQFPLSIKTWADSMVVVAAAPGNDSIFKRGTVITGINGYTNRQLLDSMFQLMSTDGYADNFKSQLASFNFPAYYRTAFGTDSVYRIRYIDTAGIEQETALKTFTPKRDTTRRRPPGKPPSGQVPPLTRKERKRAEKTSVRSLSIDTTFSTGYMRLTTFSSGHLRRFFRQSFRQLKKDHVSNLIIDLRENGGGSIGVSTKLARYVSDHPFKVADTVAAKSRRFRYGRYIHPSWVYWLSMRITSRRKKDGLYHFGYYERHHFKPQQKNHFAGQIYILQGGFTFSASTMFISEVKNQSNIHVVGEETGGGNYGNSSVHLPAIQLPYSKMQITLPMYRIVLDSTRAKNGRGIQPEIPVSPSSVDLRRGIDNKMLKVKTIIEQSRTTTGN
ncbi:C-terminal processing protease CtpA/Prc [Filimonas zeae]|uniref:Peptidase S41 n=1 Tax=Filimonas zeae TaxID=1737353 RepID=A0A917J5J9_9BACT|nr:S41 family peptidase [Filimonas zeae]MDR6342665.1 C-terminal processing protease CtpA/Prc [Filimonas zeae]GGH82221.1 peptidase S41 [Filimonas zeae]